MGQLKQHQPSMTIDGQVENLKSLGLIINDEEYAKKILNDISYFRLVKAYSLGFKSKNGEYNDGVTFEQIVELDSRGRAIQGILRVTTSLICQYACIIGYLATVATSSDREIEQEKFMIRVLFICHGNK